MVKCSAAKFGLEMILGFSLLFGGNSIIRNAPGVYFDKYVKNNGIDLKEPISNEVLNNYWRSPEHDSENKRKMGGFALMLTGACYISIRTVGRRWN